MLTYQDFLESVEAGTKEKFILKAIDEYLISQIYTKAIEADKYFDGENTEISLWRSLITVADNQNLDLSAAIKTPAGIFKRLIIQQVESLWENGVQVENPETKAKLGEDFDYTAKNISEYSALHSVAYGFWNYDKLQMFTALEYFPLKDERTGNDMAGIRFWQLDADKPWVIQLYEIDGWTEYKRKTNGAELELITKKQAYKKTIRRDAISTEVVRSENYSDFSVLAMYANKRHKGELTRPIKNKIDLMDFILSGFGDNVMRTKVIYWVLKGFSGELKDLLNILGEINELGITAPTDSSEAKAETIDLPFAAVKFALDILEKGIYLDFMGMNMSEISGGSLTNVAIQTAQYNLKLKTGDFEWQAFDFTRRLLKLIGIKTENIKFKRGTISNDMEVMQMVVMAAPWLDEQTILEKMPIVGLDEVKIIMDRKKGEAYDNT